ncbi:cobyrinic acid a,c-diamide synthase [Candidatus Magnetobacterium bavaricum]|uniref:Cobyrinic acid a,c-diamide synthase n=1 Tax=Candidatus Magnetobacterium bavaricum TaxID=29290 RepID=A0A0F3GVM3_9BACT|nr:cobyrinic acid a,c-diamide synthase [Candidatus Magnetobacterium bavaricum]
MFTELYQRGDDSQQQTVQHLFLARGDRNKFHIDRAIIKNVCSRGKIVLRNLDLLPADYNMIDLEQHLADDLATLRLRHVLHKEKIINNYNYVLIDCAPSFSKLTRSALLASDFYIIPAIPDFLSRFGINILTIKVNETVAEFNTNLKLLGITFNLGNSITTLNQEAIDSITSNLDELKINGMVDNDARIFKPWIPHLIGITKASDLNFPLVVTNLNKEKGLYADLTKDILSHKNLQGIQNNPV